MHEILTRDARLLLILKSKGDELVPKAVAAATSLASKNAGFSQTVRHASHSLRDVLTGIAALSYDCQVLRTNFHPNLTPRRRSVP
jgi:hypothetical protein